MNKYFHNFPIKKSFYFFLFVREFSKSPMRSLSRDPPASVIFSFSFQPNSMGFEAPARSRTSRDKSREREMPPNTKKTHKRAQTSAALLSPGQRKKARHKSMGDGRLVQSSMSLRAPPKSKRPGHKRSRSAQRDDGKALSRSSGKVTLRVIRIVMKCLLENKKTRVLVLE